MLSNPRDDLYQVQLPAFEGPLDLLLQLIEREKLDISAISLAQVADQFIAHVRTLEEIAADTLADFLVVAARLVWIKSRLLLPRAAKADAEEEEDPAEALARQLREYKRFKEAAAALRAIEESGLHTYTRLAPPPEMERRLEPDPSALIDLLAAAQTALAQVAPTPDLPGGLVVPFTLTIHDQITHIRRVTAGGHRVSFRSLLTGARHRLEIIVTLLAVLEMVKMKRVNVTQEMAFGEIFIEPVAGADDAADEDDDLGLNGNVDGT